MIKRLWLLVIVFLVVFFAGCENHTQQNAITPVSSTQTTSHESKVSDSSHVIRMKISSETDFVESNDLPIVVDYSKKSFSQVSDEVLVKVENNNYSRAYAKALLDGTRIPSEEATVLIETNKENVQNEPRIVINGNDLHIVWTNNNMFLVIDGDETDKKVSDCIFIEELPQLPENIEELKKHHKSNEQVRYGIAETAFLEDLCMQLKEKELYEDGLHRIRFYQYNGSPVAVYSLKQDGELYINTSKATEILN